MKKEKAIKIRNASVVSTLVIAAVLGIALLMISSNVSEPIVRSIPQAEPRHWGPVGADGDPGAGASGVLEIFIYPHSADPTNDYATNLSSASAYASTNTLNSSCSGDVPYDTTFDIVVKCRLNATHCWNSTASAWEDTWNRAYSTSADLSLSAQIMEQVHIANDTGGTAYIYYNFYLQDSDGGAGSGFTISHGENVNVTLFELQAYS